MKKPNTNYTKSGRVNIAYQVFGTGSFDLVYIPGWVSNIDLMWSCPELVSFLTELGKVARVILFDKRGTGLSDRIVELSTLEERMEDITAVMDAVGSEKAILFGHSEGGSVSALFAATYPNRTVALLTFGVFAKRRFTEDYPWAPKDEQRQEVYDMIENSWGSGDMNLDSLAPSKANDKVFMDWLANYFRSGASPSAALILTKMNTSVDIIGILPSINVPTLILQRTNDIDVKIEEGKFIAKRIKGARFVEFHGDDHLFWVGNTREVLDEMIGFINALKLSDKSGGQLLTIMVAEIIQKPEVKSLISIDYEQIDEQLIQKYKGTLHHIDGNICVATFAGSAKAIHCCLDFKKTLEGLNLSLKAGIHVGDCFIEDNKLAETEAVIKTRQINSIAKSKQILISQTAKFLIPNMGLKFSSFQPSPYIALPNLFTIEDILSANVKPSMGETQILSKNGFLLDHVMQYIEDNLNSEQLTVEMLCDHLGLSERQMQRKIKAVTNKSPNQLIRSVRLHRAKELLIGKIDDVAQIAFQTGFTSPSYFSKCFKNEFGMSPSELISLD
ncbi:alpha/beta fold hydrolase [uncultured Arcticibacterium sp.]|uniref:alpha/beta fold hydrolase n=1 Tax=uncultured Arcticibacterium sp. TaxID=2173042 RepID=UPI0030FBACC7